MSKKYKIIWINMTRIKEKFAELDGKNQKVLIAYIMAGFPNEKATLSTVRGLVKGGADIIELGFPFSDPLADGPVIQNASTISLNNGTTISKFFSLIKKIRSFDCRAGVALNPDRPIKDLKPILNDVDLILVMSVFPGRQSAGRRRWSEALAGAGP